jgi:hypothetical protein
VIGLAVDDHVFTLGAKRVLDYANAPVNWRASRPFGPSGTKRGILYANARFQSLRDTAKRRKSAPGVALGRIASFVFSAV